MKKTSIYKTTYFKLTHLEAQTLKDEADYYNLTQSHYIKNRLFNIYIKDNTQYAIYNVLVKIKNLLHYSYSARKSYLHLDHSLHHFEKNNRRTLVTILKTLNTINQKSNPYNASNKTRIHKAKQYTHHKIFALYFDEKKYNRCTQDDVTQHNQNKETSINTGSFKKKNNDLKRINKKKLTFTETEYHQFNTLKKDIINKYPHEKITQTDIICSKLFFTDDLSIIYEQPLINKYKEMGYQYKNEIDNKKNNIKTLTDLIIKLKQYLNHDFLKNNPLTNDEKYTLYNNYNITYRLNGLKTDTIEQAKNRKKTLKNQTIKIFNILTEDEYIAHNNNTKIRLNDS